MSQIPYGFVGLGAMGGPMAHNLAAAGHNLVAFDIAGTAERAPEGSMAAQSLSQAVGQAETVFLSLPDGPVSAAVAAEICATADRATSTVIDFSTVGIAISKEICATYAKKGIAYIDAPVSGGQAGAKAGTLTIIWGGSAEILDRHRPALDAVSGNVFHMGDQAGQGQAMKLLNNFLSATALAATSEAIAFGLEHGLDMTDMLDVLNVSTGRNTATSDKFPKRVVTGSFDAGFRTSLMAKDLVLYFESVVDTRAPDKIGRVVHDLWQKVDESLPGSDFTQIYQHVTAHP
ncbi:MAG: NAD(P)-dependent oxidoreductase [Alphaproteobacteria bacterium]|nr:NAD(P)-dependent oxidoreductase [Alphaproteobacteria bacterium]